MLPDKFDEIWPIHKCKMRQKVVATVYLEKYWLDNFVQNSKIV